jgi:hypothetical protein
MPYSLKRNEKGDWCVSNKETGESKGCSTSRAKGVANMRALYSASAGEKMGKKEVDEYTDLLLKELEKEYPAEAGVGYWSGVTSFAELDQERAAREAAQEISQEIWNTASDFQMLASNIQFDPAVENKLEAVSALAEEMAQRLAREIPQEITDAEDETKEISGWFDTLKANFLSLFKFKKTSEPLDKYADFMLWKETDGSTRWFARYSNSFRDRDKPAQIVSSASHKRFVERVEKGLAPKPELWLYHVPEWKIGEADWVGWDDIGKGIGFAMASGTIDKEVPQKIVDWLDAKCKELGVSHGMPYSTLKFETDNGTIIAEHETKEISPLPTKDRAANPIGTDFILTKEADNMIPKNKRDELIARGISPDALDALEKLNAFTASKAVEEGMEFKETNEEPAPVQEKAAEEIIMSENQVPVGEPPISRTEIADAISAVLQPHFEKLAALDAKLIALEDNMKEIGIRVEDKETLMKNMTPTASLQAQLINRLIGTGARVETNDPLLNRKPKETPPVDPNSSPTGIDFIDKMIGSGR